MKKNECTIASSGSVAFNFARKVLPSYDAALTATYYQLPTTYYLLPLPTTYYLLLLPTTCYLLLTTS